MESFISTGASVHSSKERIQAPGKKANKKEKKKKKEERIREAGENEKQKGTTALGVDDNRQCAARRATPCGSLFDGVEDPSSTACGTFYYEGSWGTATSLFDTDGATCSQSQCVNLAERASSSDSTCQVGDVVLPSSQTVAPAFTPSVDLRVVLSAENTQMGNGKGVDPQGWSAPFVFQASSTFFDGVTLQTYLVQMRPALMGWPPFPQALPAMPSSASLAGASWFDLPKGQATTSSSSSSFTFTSFTTTVFWRQLMQSGTLDANTIVATPYENATFQTRSWPLLQQDLGSAPAGVDGDFAMRRSPKGHVTTYAMWRLNLCFQARSDSSDRCTLYAAQCPAGADPTFDGFRFTSDGIMYTDGCEDQTERQCFYAVLDPDSGDAGLVLGQPCAAFDQGNALYGVPGTVVFTAASASTTSSVDCRTMQLTRGGHFVIACSPGRASTATSASARASACPSATSAPSARVRRRPARGA